MSKFLLLNLGGFSSTRWVEFFWLQDKSLTLVTSSPQVSPTVGRSVNSSDHLKVFGLNEIPYELELHQSEFLINHENISTKSETILSHHHHTGRKPRIQHVSAVTLGYGNMGCRVSKGWIQN